MLKEKLSSIKVSELLQYLLIIMFLYIPGSSLYAKVIPSIVKIVIFIFLLAVTLLNKGIRNNYTLAILFILTIITFFGRLMVGGIGVKGTIDFLNGILICNAAININKKMFCTRLAKCAKFFFGISLLFFIIQLIFPSFFQMSIFHEYLTAKWGVAGYEKYEYSRGFILYTYNANLHPYRNCGIYTEPGVYQIMINFILYIVLFKSDYIGDKSLRNQTLIVALLCLLSCQSTTGFISFLILAIFYIFNRKYKSMQKNIFVFILLLILLIAVFDFAIRGENSLIYENFIGKVFSNGQLDLTIDTGYYRIGMIELCVDSMIKNPFGIGYNNFTALIKGTGYVAASILSFGVVYGVVALILVIIWLLYPYFLNRKYSLLLLFIFLFLNTTLAQTDLFYPGLIGITYLNMNFSKRRKKYDYINC